MTRAAFEQAARELVDDAALPRLWGRMRNVTGGHAAGGASFNTANLFYYAGAVVVIGAMSCFMTMGWSSPPFIFIVSLAYQVGLFLGGNALWQRGLTIPGGLLLAAFVSLTQLTVFGLQKTLGVGELGSVAYPTFHVFIRQSFVWMELTTILVGGVTLHYFYFPFIVAPIAWSFWYLSMDLVPLLVPNGGREKLRATVTQVIGVLNYAASAALDTKAPDLGWWLCLGGVLMFWFATTMRVGTSWGSGGEATKAALCAMNVAFLVASVALGRAIFAVCGTLGLTSYLMHLAHTVFRDSPFFPIILSAVGLAVMYIGYLLHAHQNAIRALFGLPPVVAEW